MPTPRYMTHCAASRPKFNDPGQRREVTAKLPCTLRDQQSDAGAPRAITPKREAMWRNFGGSQAALITGHAVNAHSGNVKPILAPKTLAESSSSRTNSPSRSLNASGGGGSIYYPNNNNNNDASLNRSNTLQQRRLSSGSMNNTINPNSRFVSVSRSQYQNPAMRSSTPPPMRSSDLLNSSLNSNTNRSHWSKNPTSTRLIPVEKNSATIESRADSIVRGGTFPHHKNLVFPDEDPTVDTTRNRLWMHRPLKNGQFEATRKRTYNVPTFRSTSDLENNNNTSTNNIGTPTSAAAAPQSRVANNTGTSFLNNSTNSSSSANNSQLHFSKRKIPVPTHIEGAGAMITEVEPRPRFMVRPQAHQAFNPPYNETGDLINVAPQEIPQAAKHLGKRHMSPIRVAGTRWEQTEGGWSDQPAPKPSGTKHYGNTTANSKDFPMTDSPPKNGELPKFRPSIVVMSGAPAFVPSTRQQQRASTPQPRMNNLSPGRRMVHTPRDHDIFGAREVKQPWHPQGDMSSKQPVLTAAPGSIEIKRCRGMGTYSPQRVQPKYSF